MKQFCLALLCVAMIFCAACKIPEYEEPETVFLYVREVNEDHFIGSGQYQGNHETFIVYDSCALDFEQFQTVRVEFNPSMVSDLKQGDLTKRIDDPIDVRLSKGGEEEPVYDKPVIYLYPETTMQVSVKLDFKGAFKVTIPEYSGGWKVTAFPDGTLLTEDGASYPYLFWEGVPDVPVKITQGFCVSGADTRDFLQQHLAYLGLNPSESGEFLEYWLPRMESNPYNLIQFQTDAYTESAKLDISPDPDSVIRVFMSYQALSEAVEIKPQTLLPGKRQGFTVVEWGGCELR